MLRLIQLLAASRTTLADAKLFSLTTIIIVAAVLALVSTVASLNAILFFKNLPYPQSAQLVDLRAAIVSPGKTQPVYGNTTALALAWQHDLGDLGQFELTMRSSAKILIDQANGDSESISVNYVSPGLFQMLGVPAAAGMTLSQIDPNEQKAKVAVLSHAIRQRLFPNGANPLNAHIVLDGENYRVVGVMPSEFLSTRALRGTADGVWLPLAVSGSSMTAWNRFSSSLEVIGRVKGNPSDPALAARISNMTATLMQTNAKGQLPADYQVSARLSPLREAVAGEAGKVSVAALIATLLLALLGLSIISMLWLARVSRRRPTLALYTVLGARFSDLTMAVVLEMVVLFAAATPLAVLLAYYFTAMVKVLGAATLPRLVELEVNFSFIGVLLLLMSLAGLAISLPTIGRLKRLDIIEVLRSAGKGQPGTLPLRTRQIILTLQFFIIITALWLACLLLNDAGKRVLTNPGFNEAGATFVQVELPAGMQSLTAKRDFEIQMIKKLIEQGHAKSVALLDMPPVSDALALNNVTEISGETIGQMQVNGVGGTYLKDIGMVLMAGRLLNEADRQELAKVTVVGQSAARLIGRGQSPLGKRIQFDKETYEVVGVVNDIKNPVQNHIGATLQAYIPFQHFDGPPSLNLILFHPGRESPPKAQIHQLFMTIDPTLVLNEYQAVAQLRAQLLGTYYIIVKLAAVLALLTLAMAISGVAAMINYLFYSATAPIATRLALGATMGDLIFGLLRILHWPSVVACAAFVLLAFSLSQKLAALAALANALVLQTALFALVLCLFCTYATGLGSARRLIRVGYRGLLSTLH
jgi:MacB-like periplasmic core domain